MKYQSDSTKEAQKMKRRKGKRTVTGLSGSCIQKEQLKLPPRRSNTSPPLAFFFFSSSSSSPSTQAFPLTINSCRLFAFSRSVREASASIARILSIRSSEAPPGAFTGGKSPAEVQQSGHSHWRAEARVSGRPHERQLTCQGVAHVLQVSFSSSEGVALQTMQMPSPSQGSWVTFAIGR
jgi:hypothetical protein